MSRKTSPSMTLEEMSAQAKQDLATGVGKSVKHESAEKQVSGEALYIDDRGEFPNQLHVYALMSPHAHATITHLDVSPCYGIDGVHTVLTAEDIPGELDIGRFFLVILCLLMEKSCTWANLLSPLPQTA